MRNPDMTYNDILARDIGLYVNLDDEEYHKLEAVTGPDGEQRYDIKICNSTNIHNKDAGADISLRSDRKTIKNVVLQEIAISLWNVYQIQSIT